MRIGTRTNSASAWREMEAGLQEMQAMLATLEELIAEAKSRFKAAGGSGAH